MQNNQKMMEESPQETASVIKNVWKYNAHKEFLRIHELLELGFTHVAMDTEFPGFLYDCGGQEINSEIIYRVVKMNVDKLNPIQVGMTFTNEKGEKPEGTNTWQFNLCFNVKTENHSPDSINLLTEAGIKFDEMAEHGIDHMVFGDYLMSSGLVVNTEVQWITFHGCYDFAYLMKSLLNTHLPETSSEFMNFLQHLFPVIWDVKVLINDFAEWKNDSLSKLATKLDLKRSGITHQAGSDALLTSNIFYSIMQRKYTSGYPETYCNKVFGLSFGGSINKIDYQSEVVNPNYYYPGQFMYPPYQYQYDVYAQMGHEYYYPQPNMIGNMMPQKFIGQYPPANPPKEYKKK
jgi:CCR4-NOT transcription complex subunit 7/8